MQIIKGNSSTHVKALAYYKNNFEILQMFYHDLSRNVLPNKFFVWPALSLSI